MSNNDIEPATLAQRLDDKDDLFLLDVRNEADYEEWQIEDSTNIPIYDELLEHDFSTLESRLEDLPSKQEIVTICVAGITSARAAEFLRDQGFDAKSVDDGMNGWGRVHRQYDVDATDGVVQIVRPGTGCVSYLVFDAGEAVVVDPSQYIDQYLNAADERDLEITGVIDTHAHADHVSGARRLAGELDVPYYLHGDDAGDLEHLSQLADGDSISVGERSLEVQHTPGHTPGSVSLQFGNALLSGDTLFLRSVGRPDLEDGDEDAIRTAANDLFASSSG